MSTRHVIGRSALLFTVLSILWYLVVSLYCEGFEWIPASLDCTFESDGTKGSGNSNSGESRRRKYNIEVLGKGAGGGRSWVVKDEECYKKCTASKFEIAYDVFYTNIIVSLLWLTSDLLNEKFKKRNSKEINRGKNWQKELEEDLELKKDELTKSNNTKQWEQHLRNWERAKKISECKRRKNIYWIGFSYFVFASVAFITMYSVIYFAPRRYSGSTDFTYVIDGLISPDFGTVYDVGMLSILFLELLFFIVATSLIKWPGKRCERESKRELLETNEDIQKDLIPETALLIATHDSCLTPERAEVFQKTLLAAGKSFPLNSIFVCDNGRGLTPSDRTEEVCHRVSSKISENGNESIQYVYIPEGNKSHAFYWVTEHWIPKLVSEGKCPNYSFVLLIDDDVVLPGDIHVSLKTMSDKPHIQSMSYAISAATEGGEKNLLVELQSGEYKLMGLMKQMQYKLGSALYCHGAIGLWRREVLGKKVLWDHDTVFDGEDLYMGFMLHRMRKNYSIGVQKGTVVPTFAPEDMLTLLRQRSRSWDLCSQRKFLTYFYEMVSNWGGHRVLILKPFLLYEMMTIILDWMRPYLFVSMGHQNPGGFILLFLLFYMILWLEVLLFNFVVLRQRPDLRMTLAASFLFPMYRTLSMVFRLLALVANAMYYPLFRLPPKISSREKCHLDIPPVPTDKSPQWDSVWKMEGKVKDDRDITEVRKSRDEMRKLCVEKAGNQLKDLISDVESGKIDAESHLVCLIDANRQFEEILSTWGTKLTPDSKKCDQLTSADEAAATLRGGVNDELKNRLREVLRTLSTADFPDQQSPTRNIRRYIHHLINSLQ